MTKVTFVADPKKEYEYHKLFQEIDEFRSMSLFSWVSIEDKSRIIKKIEQFWDKEDREVMRKVEDQWRMVEEKYFQKVVEITEEEHKFDEYFCYILAFATTIGFSNPFDKESKECIVNLSCSINPKFIVGHELFHSHYFYVIDKLGLNKANRTLFTEGVAALAFFETDLFDLFPETNAESSINSYPQVSMNWDKLVKLWSGRKSFKGFLESALKELGS